MKDDCRCPEKERLKFLAEDTYGARDQLWNVQTESAQKVLRSDRKRSEQMVEKKEREARDGDIRSTITYHQPTILCTRKGAASVWKDQPQAVATFVGDRKSQILNVLRTNLLCSVLFRCLSSCKSVAQVCGFGCCLV